MSWIRENRFLAVLIGVVVVAGAALAVMLVLAYGRFAEISDSYNKSQRELTRLKNAEIFPSPANVEALEEQREIYGEEVLTLRRQLAEIEYPLEDISPNAFQDRLRAEVSEIEKQAASRNVVLPEGFYLGFDQYQTELPRPGAAPALDRQLDAVKLLADRLMEFGITELHYIRRAPLPEESGNPPAPPAPEGKRGRNSNNKGEPRTGQLYSKQILDFGFRSSPSVFQDVVNAIAQAEAFLVVRTLSVRNEMQEGPLKSETPQVSASRPTPETSALNALFGETGGAEAGTDGENAAERLQFLVGQEKVDVELRLEIIDFTEPAENDGGNG